MTKNDKLTIKNLRAENASMIRRIAETERDRDLYRNFIVQEYITQRTNSNENKYSPPIWIMSRIAHVLGKGQPFHSGI